jgi:hypothetical protein
MLGDTVFTGNASPTWRAIEYGLELLKKGIVWRVGNGATIRAWRDLWIPREVVHCVGSQISSTMMAPGMCSY